MKTASIKRSQHPPNKWDKWELTMNNPAIPNTVVCFCKTKAIALIKRENFLNDQMIHN